MHVIARTIRINVAICAHVRASCMRTCQRNSQPSCPGGTCGSSCEASFLCGLVTTATCSALCPCPVTQESVADVQAVPLIDSPRSISRHVSTAVLYTMATRSARHAPAWHSKCPAVQARLALCGSLFVSWVSTQIWANCAGWIFGVLIAAVF